MFSAGKQEEQARSIYGQLFKHLQEMRLARTGENKADKAEAARKLNEATKKLKQWTGSLSPTPFALAKWLRENGLLNVEGDEPCVSARPTFPAAIEGEDDVPADLPLFIPATCGGVGGLLRTLPAAMDITKVNKLVADYCRTLNKAEAKGMVMMRVAPRGQPWDSLGMAEWVPLPWRASKSLPEKLDDFGSPWFIGQSFGTLRKGIRRWPMHGIGQFVVGVSGDVILCCWPGHSALARGCEWTNMEQFLFNLNHARFREWADVNVRAVHLGEGDVAWIPYGWVAATVGNSVASVQMIQPYIAANLAMRCRPFKDLAAAQRAMVEGNMGNPKTPWSLIGRSFLDWLLGVEATGVHPPVHLAALADGPATEALPLGDEEEDDDEVEDSVEVVDIEKSEETVLESTAAAGSAEVAS